MDNKKNIHQLNQEQETRMTERGEANAQRKLKKAVKRGDLSGTKAGLNLAAEARENVILGIEVQENIQEAIEQLIAETEANGAKTPSGWLRELKVVPSDVVAELALRVCLDSVGAQFTQANTIVHLAEAMEAAVLNWHMRSIPAGKDFFKNLNRINKEEGGSKYTMRQRAIYIASKPKMRQMHDAKGQPMLNDDGSRKLEIDPNHYYWSKWTDSLKVKVGGIMMAGVQRGAANVFVFEKEKEDYTDEHVVPRIQFTEWAQENLTSELDELCRKSPMHGPLFDVPNDWGLRTVGPYGQLSLNMLTPIVKNMSPDQVKAVDEAMLDGSLDEAMSALNSLQRVPYSLNADIVDLVEWTVKKIEASEGRLKVEGFPSLSKVEALEKKSSKETQKMSDADRSAYLMELTSRRKHNREVPANLLALKRRLEEANHVLETMKPTKDQIAIDRFYLPMNWDFRGRIYHLAEFGFQNTDYMRAMFLFADKGKVTKKNEHHLFHHLANMFGCGIDKESHAARKAWAERNMDKILAVGKNPKDDVTFWEKNEPITGKETGETESAFEFWYTCDEPFQFAAACIEMYRYSQHGEGYETGLPIQKDATQSGMQFYAMLARSRKDGEKVNLTASGSQSTPGDIYINVRDKAEEMLLETVAELEAKEAEGTLEGDEIADLRLAKQWKDYGLRRGLMKTPVMTLAYGSDLYGFAKSIRDNDMKELTRDVREGRRDKHPFHCDDDAILNDEGYKASWFMAKIIKEAILKTVTSAADGMDYLQKMAKLCHTVDLQFAYKTPLNFPMMQYCRDEKKRKLQVEMPKWENEALSKRGSVSLQQYHDTINRDEAMNGASPNFIHSLDATLLMKSVLLCRSRGITNVMTVHDSFSTTIDNVDMMVDAIKTSFVDLFEDYCPYDALMQQTMQRIADKMKLPDQLDLDIKEVLDSEYAFS